MIVNDEIESSDNFFDVQYGGLYHHIFVIQMVPLALYVKNMSHCRKCLSTNMLAHDKPRKLKENSERSTEVNEEVTVEVNPED